jgi:hypothetical protein
LLQTLGESDQDLKYEDVSPTRPMSVSRMPIEQAPLDVENFEKYRTLSYVVGFWTPPRKLFDTFHNQLKQGESKRDGSFRKPGSESEFSMGRSFHAFSVGSVSELPTMLEGSPVAKDSNILS